MARQTLTTASFDFLHNTQSLDYIMNATDYWPFVREYFVCNTTVATLQLWPTDLEPHVLSSAIEQVYNAFFYTTFMHLLCHQSEKVLFHCFLTMLNASFESKLTLEDKGHESGSENFNIPTPLKQTPRTHQVMFLMRISPLTLLHHTPQLPASHITSLYVTGYHLVALMTKKLQNK